MSKIRFIRISSLPTEYYSSFYKKDRNMAFENYEKQYRTIMDDFFGFSDFWKINLEKTSKFEAMEILGNVAPLQKKWAEENKIKYKEENWKEEIINNQISFFKPDVVFVPSHMETRFKKEIRRNNPSIRLMISWDGAFINDPKKFEGCDMILSDDPINAGFYSEHGFITYHFSFGFEKKILDKITAGGKTNDVSFIGSLQMRDDFHLNRLKFLSAVSKKVKLKTWIPYFPSLFGPIEKSWIVQAKKIKPKYFLDALRIFKTNHGGVFGLKMYDMLANSKITLNMHGDEYIRAGNMRLWEATGVGTCLVTDYKNNITDYFEPDKEIVTYRSIPEAVDKIKYLLNNDQERKKIAEAGQKRTLKDYSLEKRISLFTDFLLNKLT